MYIPPLNLYYSPFYFYNQQSVSCQNYAFLDVPEAIAQRTALSAGTNIIMQPTLEPRASISTLTGMVACARQFSAWEGVSYSAPRNKQVYVQMNHKTVISN